MKMFEQKRASDRTHRQRSAFTLIEMMVVVALVGILIGGVFRLLNAAGEGAKRGETIERMQRIENALSGFYAAYGSYPPVQPHGSPDPFVKEAQNGTTSPASSLTAENANRAAACQPMAFEFPPMKALDTYINKRYQTEHIQSPNGGIANLFPQNGKWPDVKLYRYGVVSFLVPRYDAIGDFKLEASAQYIPQPINEKALVPEASLYKNHKMWTDFNPPRKAKAEREACARWLPNLQGIIHGGRKLLGVETGVPHCDNESQLSEGGNANRAYEYKGSKYFLRKMTIRDAWGNDFYYHSAPPYQSYRLWSAGPDGTTFPADYPLQQLSAPDRKTVSNWIKDDIAHPSR